MQHTDDSGLLLGTRLMVDILLAFVRALANSMGNGTKRNNHDASW